MKKDELCPGDVVLFPPHEGDFIAWAIAALTDGIVNHAALCYPDKGELLIAESILKDGLVLNPFPKQIDLKYPLKISRMKNQSNLEPVLAAAQKYLKERNTYPNFNLGLLGLLLLFKKIAPHTLKNAVVYCFMVAVAGELMRLVKQRKHTEKHPMSCSQFVAQCFTDAGKDYDLKFDALVIDFKLHVENSIVTRSTVYGDSTSLIDILEQSDKLSVKTRSLSSEFDQVDEVNENELELTPELTSEFIRVINGKSTLTRSSGMVDRIVSTNLLRKVSEKIVLSLYELQKNIPAADLEEALTYLKSSESRNHFVSPQDLLINCPNSLEFVGDLSYN
jgi:hypothetical protein